MLKWLNVFSKKQCYFCKVKNRNFSKYKDDKGVRVYVCTLCLEYAERRALRKS